MTQQGAQIKGPAQAPRTIRAQLKALRRQRVKRHMEERLGLMAADDQSLADKRLPEVELRWRQTQDAPLTQSPLSDLPGVGPSLIWMLNECGITSLGDLATADPAQLSDSLGVVGQILDVEAWVAFANVSGAAKG